MFINPKLSTPMSVSFYTIGCKLNQAETDEIINHLINFNVDIVNFKSKSDIAVIRACAVTENASQTTRELIRRAKKNGSFTIVSGCLENIDLPEIDLIAYDSKEIINKILKLENNNNFSVKNNYKKKTRAFIKIQTGCNFQCSYCTIPKYRGKSVSLPPKKIIQNIQDVISEDCQEIVLTGVNICQYKYKHLNLSDLLELILNKTTIKRIRLGSLDPRLITDNLIKIFINDRLMPHWHLSLQSGSDKILKMMNRGYTTNHYLNITKKILKINPLFSFTTDIIVGFPDESDDDFRETIHFTQKIGFSKIHIFPYSPRLGTKALLLPNKVKNFIIKERVMKLKKIANQLAINYQSKLIGKTRAILFEQKKNNYWQGYSPEYIFITINDKKNLKNKIVNLKLTKKIINKSNHLTQR